MRLRLTLLAAMVAALPSAPSLANAAPIAHQGVRVPASRGASVGERRPATSPIAHVVFIVQENRSFNNLFMGYPGATTQSYGYDTTGNKISLRSQQLSTSWDVDHNSSSFFAACDSSGGLPGTNCKLDGWNNEGASSGHPANYAYAYVPRSEIVPYWQIANSYVLADNMFQSNLDGSFVAHQYTIGAYADTAVDFPSKLWGCEGGQGDKVPTLTKNRTYGSTIVSCFSIPTIASEADAAGMSWKSYAGPITGDGGLWSSFQANSYVYHGSDWKSDVISPPSRFLSDIASGVLPTITWVMPNMANSDHGGYKSSTGPAWVASLVNAVGNSKFWNSTAIFIMWDDWGGWFDSVQPVFEDYDGLGFRVPLLMVSAYAKQGYVTHVQYETSSVLRFMEDNFGLGQLAASDARANDPAGDAFNYNQTPRPFKSIGGALPYSYWIMQDRLYGSRRDQRTGAAGD